MTTTDKYVIDVINELSINGTKDENVRAKWVDGKSAHTLFITQWGEKYSECPFTSARSVPFKKSIAEILWIYQKQSSSLSLAREMGIDWWEEWKLSDDTIGSVYGATIKQYDLMNNLLKGLKNNPFGRRHIMSLWQEESFKQPYGLLPCAYETLWSVRKQNNEYYLDMTLIQRSSDYVAANHINKFQYYILLCMVAGHLNYQVGTFYHFVQNLHVYDRHMWALDEFKNNIQNPVKLEVFVPQKDFYSYQIDDIVIKGKRANKLSKTLEIAI
jgi:thymidylate synthase